MIGEIRVRYSGAVPGIVARELNRIKKAAWIAVGIFWHGSSRMRAGHFTVAGGRRHGYLPRKGQELPFGTKKFWRSYAGQKQRLVGHQRPLLFSGDSLRASRIQKVKATATNKKSKCKVILPPGFNRRHPASKINMRAEVTHITIDEARKLVKKFDGGVDKGIKAIRKTQTKKVF